MAAPTEQRLEWTHTADGLRHTEVAVPVDYTDSDGETLSIALTAHPATRQRIGVLLVCPDDPGNPGTRLVPELVRSLPEDVVARFDLVGFDHRFSGRSAPLSAGLTADELYWAFHHPESAEAEAEFQRNLVTKCFGTLSEVLPHITTRNIARDVDVIRAALGEERISLLGHSYGGHIATVYSELFGQRTDRIVVDSVIDPDWVWRDLFLTVAEGAQNGLDRWARWCARRGEIGRTRDEVLGYLDRLLTAEQPLNIGPVPVSGALLRMLTVVMLSTERTYGVLAGLLRVAGGDAQPDSELMEGFGALFGEPKAESAAIAHLAILSGECEWPTDIEFYRAEMTVAAQRFPLVGAAMAAPKAGAFWPVEPREPVVRIGADSRARSVLLVQSDSDPFTPPSGALHVRELLPDNSRLVLATDFAHHRLYPFSGHAGVLGATTDYLLSGRLPETDLTMGRNP